MSKASDIVIVGSGLAGLTAAMEACRAGASVTLISEGAGSIAISGGYVDLLGYDGAGVLLDDPWKGIAHLAGDHPYSIAGTDMIKLALKNFQDIIASHGWPMLPAADCHNTRIPTIMGTLKPTYLMPAGLDYSCLQKARSVLVASIQGLRDCKCALIVNQLRRYPGWEDKKYGTLVLPIPFQNGLRSVSSLDIARHVEKKAGFDWLIKSIGTNADKYDLVLIPPICGCHADSAVWQELRGRLQRPVVEMISIPPGVGGLRLSDAIMRELFRHDFRLIENARVIRADRSGARCVALIAQGSGQQYRYSGDAFIIATGGILGGGIVVEPGKAYEAIFGINLHMPENVDEWTSADFFGKHVISTLGVKTDASMRPVDSEGNPLLENVHFCGRSLSGYDFTAEKSGHGVALASGHLAAGKALGR